MSLLLFSFIPIYLQTPDQTINNYPWRKLNEWIVIKVNELKYLIDKDTLRTIENREPRQHPAIILFQLIRPLAQVGI